HLAWHSYNLKRAFNDQGRLTLLERRSGRTRRLMPRLDRATTRHGWSADGSALYFLVEDRGRQELCRLGLNDAMPGKIATGGATAGVPFSSPGPPPALR